jgi:hypothetical protein
MTTAIGGGFLSFIKGSALATDLKIFLFVKPSPIFIVTLATDLSNDFPRNSNRLV